MRKALYRESFCLTWTKITGFQGQKSNKSDLFCKSLGARRHSQAPGTCALHVRVPGTPMHAPGHFLHLLGTWVSRSALLGASVRTVKTDGSPCLGPALMGFELYRAGPKSLVGKRA